MNSELSLNDWLNQNPLPEEIRENEDGSKYIPIEFIKPKLDFLSPNWGTKNFTHSIFETDAYDKAGNKVGRNVIVSGSVELLISYSVDIRTEKGKEVGVAPFIKTINRTLSGSATFDTQKYYPNTAWAQTCLSLCIVAAAKELGIFFGKNLNKEILTIPTEYPNLSKKKSKIINAVNDVTKNLNNRSY